MYFTIVVISPCSIGNANEDKCVEGSRQSKSVAGAYVPHITLRLYAPIIYVHMFCHLNLSIDNNNTSRVSATAMFVQSLGIFRSTLSRANHHCALNGSTLELTGLLVCLLPVGIAPCSIRIETAFVEFGDKTCPFLIPHRGRRATFSKRTLIAPE